MDDRLIDALMNLLEYAGHTDGRVKAYVNLCDEDIKQIEEFYLTNRVGWARRSAQQHPAAPVTTPTPTKNTSLTFTCDPSHTCAFLPPGNYLVIDPCYVLDGIAYERVCKALYDDNANRDHAALVLAGVRAAFVFQTRHGDGTYPVHAECGAVLGRAAVDSGLLAIWPADMFPNVPSTPDGIEPLGVHVTLTRPSTVRRVNGDLVVVDGNILVCTCGCCEEPEDDGRDVEDEDWLEACQEDAPASGHQDATLLERAHQILLQVGEGRVRIAGTEWLTDVATWLEDYNKKKG